MSWTATHLISLLGLISSNILRWKRKHPAFISSRLAGIPRRLMTETEKEPVCVFAAMSVPIPSAFGCKVLESRTSCLALTGGQTDGLSHGHWFVKKMYCRYYKNASFFLSRFKFNPCRFFPEKVVGHLSHIFEMFECLFHYNKILNIAFLYVWH